MSEGGDGFSDPIVAGNTLVREAIQSEPFVSGSTGWRIERTGNAEFNDVSIRGSLEVTGSGGTLEINVDILGQPMIEFTAPNGNQYKLEADNSSFAIGGLDNFSGNTQLYFVENEGIALRSSQTGAPSVLFDYADGFLRRGIYSPWTEETWHNQTLLNGWNTTGVGAFDPPGAMLHVDGTVRLRGVTVAGTKTDGTVIFTLPAGYRPARRKHIAVSSDTAGQTPVIQIFGLSDGANAGQVQIFRMGTANAIGLDSVTFEII